MSVVPTLRQQSNSRFKLGRFGETQARMYLESLGYSTLFQNIRCRNLEIDLVLKDSNTHELVFCEVKTRTNSFNTEDLISYRKMNALRKASFLFVTAQKTFINYRVDLVTILVKEEIVQQVQHLQNITV